MRVSEAMTRHCEAVKASDSLRQAAQRMRDKDIGALFVNDDSGQVAGIITDRDITVRAVAEAASADSEVGRYMSRDVISCYEDDDLAQADIAQALGRAPLTGELLRDISRPSDLHSQQH